MNLIVSAWKSFVQYFFLKLPFSRKLIWRMYQKFSPDSILSLLGAIAYSPSIDVKKRSLSRIEKKKEELFRYFGSEAIPLLGRAILDNPLLHTDLHLFNDVSVVLIFREILLSGTAEEFRAVTKVILGDKVDLAHRDDLAKWMREVLNPADTIIRTRIQEFQYPPAVKP
jgi:hypothetical protein